MNASQTCLNVRPKGFAFNPTIAVIIAMTVGTGAMKLHLLIVVSIYYDLFILQLLQTRKFKNFFISWILS